MRTFDDEARGPRNNRDRRNNDKPQKFSRRDNDGGRDGGRRSDRKFGRDDDYKPRLRKELVDIIALKCAIYTSKWLLEGGEGKSSLPDDTITPTGCPGIISGADIIFIEKRTSFPAN